MVLNQAKQGTGSPLNLNIHFHMLMLDGVYEPMATRPDNLRLMRRRPRRAALGPLSRLAEKWPQTVAWQVRQIGELPRKDAPPALVTPPTIPQTARKGRFNFLSLA